MCLLLYMRVCMESLTLYEGLHGYLTLYEGLYGSFTLYEGLYGVSDSI